jgi:hypothetical protein
VEQFKDQRPHISEPTAPPDLTFGFGAVASANAHAFAIEKLNSIHPRNPDYPKHAQEVEFWRLIALGQLKTDLTVLENMNVSGESKFNSYLDQSVPEYMRNAIVKASKQRRGLMWAEWLSEDPDLLLNVLQWHNYEVAQQSENESVQIAFRIHEHLFLVEAGKLYDEGTLGLPPKEIDNSKLIISDIFDAILHERLGYYMPGTTEVAVVQGKGIHPIDRIRNLKNSFPRILTHEFVHLFLNRSIDVVDSPLSVRWINEAVTEMIAERIRKAMNQYDEDEDVYRPERQLLTLLISHSQDEDESLRLAFRASSGTEEDRQAFISHIDESWGTSGVIEKINDAVVAEEKLITASNSKLSPQAIQTQAINTIHDRLTNKPEAVLFIVAEQVERNRGKVA